MNLNKLEYNMKIRSYRKFFEEVTIKGNEGVPGEGSDKSGSKYLSDVERRAKSRLELTGRENPQQLGMEIMRMVGRSSQLIRGKERQLEELAKEAILSEYGSILDGVNLDIKLVRPGTIKMDDEEGEEEEMDMPKFDLTKDKDLRKEVDKAKILNGIIQGEAKNTKGILHTELVKDGIDRIFGDDSEEIFDIWDKISKIADKMDWIIPINIKADMMKNVPEGLAGKVKVEWKPKDKKDEKDKEDKDPEDILKDLEDEEDDSTPMESFEPTVIARGIDFPMLLHETVKGIYELISAHSIPDDKEMAGNIKLNTTSFEDEAEDFRYGPELASDLRDFVNSVVSEKSKTNKRILNYKNIREFVFGKMVDRNYIKTEDFLKLFRGILSKTQEARDKISLIIDEIDQELSESDREERSYNIDDIISKSASSRSDEKDQPIERKKSLKEIQQEIDAALDAGDFKKVGELSSLMNELYPQK